MAMIAPRPQHLLCTFKAQLSLVRMIRARNLGLKGTLDGFVPMALWKYVCGYAQLFARKQTVAQTALLI
jgi:hypothetical protein